MDWKNLFFSAEGRISVRDFWIGLAVLVCAWVVSHLLLVLAPLAWLVILYCTICLTVKRLHDAGRSGWFILIPVVVGAAAISLAVVFGGMAVFSGAFAMMGGDPVSWSMLISSALLVGAFFLTAMAVKVVFIVWVGLARGDAGANLYGPPPADHPLARTPVAVSPAPTAGSPGAFPPVV